MFVEEALQAVAHTALEEGRAATSKDVADFWDRTNDEAGQALYRAWKGGFVKRRRCWGGTYSFEYELRFAGRKALEAWEEQTAEVTECGDCGEVVDPDATVCPRCGAWGERCGSAEARLAEEQETIAEIEAAATRCGYDGETGPLSDWIEAQHAEAARLRAALGGAR